MAPDRVRMALNALPFHPFVVETWSGKRVNVEHPDCARLSPAGRTLVVFSADSEHMEMIDVFLITSLSLESGSESALA